MLWSCHGRDSHLGHPHVQDTPHHLGGWEYLQEPSPPVEAWKRIWHSTISWVARTPVAIPVGVFPPPSCDNYTQFFGRGGGMYKLEAVYDGTLYKKTPVWAYYTYMYIRDK